MRKIFVLDTNVLIHDPYCIYKFEDNEVVVPIFVIEEIDKLKRNPNTAIQARLVSRVIDEIRKKGSLYQGVELENDIFFRVEINNNKEDLPEVLRRDIVDNMIISVTLGIQKKNLETRVVIVSKDINMRIKADALNLEVQDYKNDKVDYSELYTGFIDISVSEDLLEDYGKLGKISIDKLALSPENLTPNCFIRMNCEKEFSTGRYANGKVRKIILGDIEAWGLRARNEEQRFAMELLMDESVKVVTLVGGAGTGKTLLAIAA
ncbi:MAG: PIN domain-containing protein, partial [Fusobacterium necrophorum]|nr:PIN domain-containing protein [Fusobacterium necrophorum]